MWSTPGYRNPAFLIRSVTFACRFSRSRNIALVYLNVSLETESLARTLTESYSLDFLVNNGLEILIQYTLHLVFGAAPARLANIVNDTFDLLNVN